MARLPSIKKSLPPDDPMVLARQMAIDAAGGPAALAEKLGIMRSAIPQWIVVPAERVLDVERISGVTRYALRPDVFGGLAEAFDAPMAKVIYRLGVERMAEALHLPVDEVAAWQRIPAEQVRKVEQMSGVSRYRLRPDVFGDAPEEVEAA